MVEEHAQTKLINPMLVHRSVFQVSPVVVLLFPIASEDDKKLTMN